MPLQGPDCAIFLAVQRMREEHYNSENIPIIDPLLSQTVRK
jgi:hypothetical protein